MKHTPTLPDLHSLKARILKRCGDFLGAARRANDARLLDGQDRFLNTKCGKYLLRADMVDEASSIFGLFTKVMRHKDHLLHGLTWISQKDAASPTSDLEDMQSLLYLTESANSYYRAGKLNLALKKYAAIQKVINLL